MSGYAKLRARDRITRLAGQGLDLVAFWRESSEAVASAVPYYWAPCWFTLDPASLLVTSHFHEGMPEIPNEWLAQEYYREDVNKLADVALPARDLDTARGDRRRPGQEPSLAPEHRLRRRSGDDRGPAHTDW